MTTEPPRDPLRVSVVAAHWWTAVSSGRFFTGWTLLASGIVAVGILSPFTGLEGVVPHLSAMVASLMAWAIIALACVPAAFFERRMDSARARGILVIGVLLAISVLRPFLNDALAAGLFGHTVTDGWLQRISTNALTWFTLLPLVAAAAAWYADARDTAARLSSALGVFDDLRRRVSRYAHRNADILEETVADVRARRDRMLRGQLDFDAVRAFADDVRTASHGLGYRLSTRLDIAPQAASSPLPPPRVPFPARIGRPHPLLVIVLYFVASTPYMFSLGGPLLVAASLVVLAVLAGLADLVIRLTTRGRSAIMRGLVVFTAWVGVGVGMLVAGSLVTSAPTLLLIIPLCTIPALAVVLGMAQDALDRSREQGHTLTELLARTAALTTAQTAAAREPLWRAVDLLHDRVQSRCVIFAARVDDRPVTAEEIEQFRAATDAAFDEILDADSIDSEAADLDGLLATWSGVVEVHAEIDPVSVAALQTPAVAADVVAAVSEGFVNAVKHSAARTVRLSVTADAAETELTVVISSYGILSMSGDSGLGLASFGGRARLRQDGEEVVLTVRVPIERADADASASRRWRAPTTVLRLP